MYIYIYREREREGDSRDAARSPRAPASSTGGSASSVRAKPASRPWSPRPCFYHYDYHYY